MKRTLPRLAAVSAAAVLGSFQADGLLAPHRAHAIPAAAPHLSVRRVPNCVEGVCGAAALHLQAPPAAGDATPAGAVPALAAHVMPIYPPIAQSARIHGLVLVDVSIGIDGRVTQARIVRSVPLLDDAALDAVRQWRFVPSPDSSAKVTVSVRFVLEGPSLYPRPATYRHELPSWISENFAFVYRYACRRATVEIDSITRFVTNTMGRQASARQFAFDFERTQAADVFVTLVGAGFFEAAREGSRTWKELPPVESGTRQSGDQVLVTVAAQIPVVEVVGVQPTQRFYHVLRARRGDHWKEFWWQEGRDVKHSDDEKALAAAGRRIRALMKSNLTDTGTRPVCL